jgi:hypothetical protein
MAMRAALYCCCLVTLWVGSARAAAIRLEVSPAVAPVSSLVEVTIYGEEFPLGTDGGDFSVAWSENLEYVSLYIQDPPWDLNSYSASSSALDYVDVFSFLETPGGGGARFEIATLVLLALEAGPAQIGVTSNLVGWSLAGESLDVDYGPEVDLTVTAPEPGLLLLLGTALLALGRERRPAL